MKRSLKERLARAGPIRDVGRVRSGSPVDLVLRPGPELAKIKTVAASESLARRGLSLLRAKRTVEAIIDRGEAIIHVPVVDDVKSFVKELQKVGIKAARLASRQVDVRALRNRLGLTQEQFALRFGFDIDAVQNWEQGLTNPDRAALAYLRVIERQPTEAARAQEEPVF